MIYGSQEKCRQCEGACKLANRCDLSSSFLDIAANVLANLNPHPNSFTLVVLLSCMLSRLVYMLSNGLLSHLCRAKVRAGEDTYGRRKEPSSNSARVRAPLAVEGEPL